MKDPKKQINKVLHPPYTGERGELYEILWKYASGGGGEESRISCDEIDNIITDILKLQNGKCHCGGYPDYICEHTRATDNQNIVDEALNLASKRCGKKSSSLHPDKSAVEQSDAYYKRDKLFERNVENPTAVEQVREAFEPIQVDSYPDLSGAPEEEKQRAIKEVVEMTAKPLLSTFLAFGLKTHIETMIINDVTKEEYVLTFETAEHFRKKQKFSNHL